MLKALKADVIVGTKVRLSAEHRADVGKAIAQGMDDSLKRMGRDHVDLFQLHNPLVAKDGGDKLAIDIALAEVAPALEKLKKAGKTRFIGFSGVGETAALHRAIDSKLFDTIQVVYNALNPSAGGTLPNGAPGQDYGRLFDRAKAADMGTIIIRALAGGALSGTTERHPLAMQAVDPIGSAPDLLRHCPSRRVDHADRLLDGRPSRIRHCRREQGAAAGSGAEAHRVLSAITLKYPATNCNTGQ